MVCLKAQPSLQAAPAARNFQGVQGRVVDGGDPQVFINSKDPQRDTVEQVLQEFRLCRR